MKKKIIGAALIAAMAVAAGWSYNQSKNEVEMSDLALANVEALANPEGSNREDCERSNDLCEELVIYSDGDWGLDILLDHTKKPGWL